MGAINRIFSVGLDALSVTTDADQDLWVLATPAGEQAVLHSFEITSAQTTAEAVRLRLMRRTGAGTGGSSATPKALDASTFTPNVTASTLVTAPGTAGDILACWQWTQQGTLLFLPPPELRILIPASSFLALNIQSALGGARTWSGTVYFEEA